MQRILSGLVLLVMTCGSANAVLVSSSGGLAYYDTDTSLTWVADGNLAQTSNYDADGRMNWNQSLGWIASLNAQNGGLGYLGINDWRLPKTLQPDPSCGSQIDPGAGPVQGSGFGCTGSEMGHVFNVAGISSSTPSPFSNVVPQGYWSGTEYAPDTSNAWGFDFGDTFGSVGYQYRSDKSNEFRAWAVSPVPAPPAVWLLGTGCLGLLGVARRRAMTALG